MRLKPIVASLLLLGLANSASAAMVAKSSAQIDAMNARMDRVEGLLNQNQGGTGLPAAQTQHWFNNVTISGVLNVDAITSNRSPTDDFNYGNGYRAVDMFGKDSSSNFRVADANVLMDAVINCWTSAHLGANMRDVTDFDESGYVKKNFDMLTHILIINDLGLPILDEAYITLMNGNAPFYGRFGRQYVTFGDYNVYEAVPTLTQLLSETNQVAAVVGYNDPSSLAANVYAFQGAPHFNPNTYEADRTQVQTFGATLSFGDLSTMGYQFGIGYLSNMADVAYIAYNLNDHFGHEGFYDRVHALSANAAVKSGPYDANIKYVTALDEFNVADVAHELSSTEGAEPWAVSVGGGVAFNTMQWPARFGLSYQQSGDAANVGSQGMPERRYQADVNVGISKNTSIGVILFNDRDYDRNEGGSGKSSFTGVLRLGVNIV